MASIAEWIDKKAREIEERREQSKRTLRAEGRQEVIADLKARGVLPEDYAADDNTDEPKPPADSIDYR